MFEASGRSLLDQSECGPALPFAAWKDTLATLHMWAQIAGKIRLALTPKVNHRWNITRLRSSPGFAQQRAQPEEAYYSKDLGEFLLSYDEVRKAKSPSTMLLDFMQSTYDAGPVGPRSVGTSATTRRGSGLGGSHGNGMSPFSNH